MSGFWKCLTYLAAMGLLSFFVGRALPKKWFSYERYPYRALPFEREGKLYDALGIRWWKDRLPDMSRIFPTLIPPKRLTEAPRTEQLELMLRETCIAECVHVLLAAAGFVCVPLWEGMGGWTMALLFLLGNIPFCLVQRCNRPRLVRLMRRLQARETQMRKERLAIIHEERIDFKLQYGARA